MGEFTSKVDSAIAAMGGADEQRKLQLKKLVRDYLGYQNYSNKFDSANNAKMDANIDGLSPKGIKAELNHENSKQQTEVEHYGSIMGKLDNTADQIAAQKLADEKAAAAEAKKKKEEADGLNNGVAFTPNDDLDKRILDFKQNPYNDDGSVKSLQQFEAELTQDYENKFSGDQRLYPKGYIKDRINQRFEKDYIGNEDKYMLMSRGFSEKQADENAGAIRRNTMSTQEKLAWDFAHPTAAKYLDSTVGYGDMIKQASEQTQNSQGVMVPKYSVQELIDNNPEVPEADIKKSVTPIYKQSAMREMDTLLNYSKDGVTTADTLKDAYFNGVDSAGKKVTGLEGVKKSPEYNEMTTRIALSYGDVLTSAQIEQLALSYLYSKF